MYEKILDQWGQYLLVVKSLRESTIRQYRRFVKYLFDFTGKDPEKITQQDIVDYVIDLKLKKVDVNTQALRATAIRRFFQWYSRTYKISNPAKELQPIKRKYPEFNMITPDDLLRIVEYCYKKMIRAKSERNRFRYHRDAAMFVFMADTGVRVTELIQLSIGNIRVEENKYYVIIPPGKGRVGRQFPFGLLAERSLVGEVFSSYWLMRTINMKAKPTEPLFPQTYNWPELRYYTHYNAIDKKCKRLGKILGIKMNPHSFRHFYGTWSIINGINIYVLKENMGHASLTSTEKYIHIAERLKDTTLQHSPTKGLKSPQGFSGFTKLQREIIKKGLKDVFP